MSNMAPRHGRGDDPRPARERLGRRRNHEKEALLSEPTHWQRPVHTQPANEQHKFDHAGAMRSGGSGMTSARNGGRMNRDEEAQKKKVKKVNPLAEEKARLEELVERQTSAVIQCGAEITALKAETARAHDDLAIAQNKAAQELREALEAKANAEQYLQQCQARAKMRDEQLTNEATAAYDELRSTKVSMLKLQKTAETVKERAQVVVSECVREKKNMTDKVKKMKYALQEHGAYRLHQELERAYADGATQAARLRNIIAHLTKKMGIMQEKQVSS